jgi:hypothetical protein
MTRTLLILAAVVALTACRRDAAPWSCRTPATHACSEWRSEGVPAELKAEQQQGCIAMGGTVAEGRCPEADAIGTCEPGGGSGARLVYYGSRSESQARHVCEQVGGAWRGK